MTRPGEWDTGTDPASSLVLVVMAAAVLATTSVITRTRDAWESLRDRTRAATRGCPCGARYQCRFPACEQGEGKP